MSQYILMINRDSDLCQFMKTHFNKSGYSIYDHSFCGNYVEDIRRLNPSLIVLDISLSVEVGLVICKSLRMNYNGSILALSECHSDGVESRYLNTGADDFLCKPIKIHVFEARIRALLRRSKEIFARSKGMSPISIGDLVVDPYSRQVSLGQQTIDLTSQEFDLFYYMSKNFGKTLSRDQFYQDVFKQVYDGKDRAFDLIVSRLRKKLPDSGPKIITLRNKGYVLTERAS